MRHSSSSLACTRTAKRDLADLNQRGLIEFVGEGRDGYYRLRGRKRRDVVPLENASVSTASTSDRIAALIGSES